MDLPHEVKNKLDRFRADFQALRREIAQVIVSATTTCSTTP
jgi:hypothetical protein